MKLSVLLWAFLHAILIGIVVIGISLPVISSLQTHFDLGVPPQGALNSLCMGVIGVFVGAALLGIALGMLRGERASGASAALCGLVWAIFISSSLSLSYSRQIGQTATQQASALASKDRERIQDTNHETIEQSRAGHASKDATLSALDLSSSATDATISGASKLPAMGLLIWPLLLCPLLCAFECRRAR